MGNEKVFSSPKWNLKKRKKTVSAAKLSILLASQ